MPSSSSISSVDILFGKLASSLFNTQLLGVKLQLINNRPIFPLGSIGGDYGFIAGVFLIAIPYYLILYKYVKEALRDEKVGGYSVGYAPLEEETFPI